MAEIVPFFVLLPGTGYALGLLLDRYIAARSRKAPDFTQILEQMNEEKRQEFLENILWIVYKNKETLRQP